MNRFRALAILASLLFLVGGIAPAQKQLATKSASIPAPGRVITPLPDRGLPPPDPQADRDSRENRLEDHHLPGPLDQTPPTATAADLPPNAQTPLAAPGVQLITNRGLTDSETSDITSTVGEPSLGVRGNEILYTGNWYAAFSLNAGSTFSYVNPETTFPAIPGRPFCCDQVALYDPAHDLMLWFLQYVKDSTGGTVRLAVAQGLDIPAQLWRFYDFTPQSVGGWSNEWFDFPELALGGQFLYVTTNAFRTSDDSFTRAVVLRIPLNQLAAYQSLALNYHDSTADFSYRPTHGATDIMYIGTNIALNKIRVLTWPENSTSITQDDVTVQQWSNATRVAPGPDGRDWLGRADFRMTAAWLSGDEIGFGWTASQDSTFPFPQVRFAILNRNTKALVAQPHLWNSSFAYAYPATATNSEGDVGLSVFFGGGTQFHPSHAVGYLDRSSLTWQLNSASTGTHGPSSNRWGDYLAVRPHGQDPTTWVASGYTLQGGPNASNIVPRYIRFKKGNGLTIDLAVTNPGSRVGKGDSREVRATVKMGGVPQSGVAVTFSTPNANLLTVVPPAQVMTDPNGVATAQVEGQTRSRQTTSVTAAANGKSVSAPVKVPDLTDVGFLLLVAALAGLSWLSRRGKPGRGLR